MPQLLDRMLRAARLNVQVYEEVEADPSATVQALWAVVLSSLAAGIGVIGQVGATGILFGTLAALVSWYLWAFFTYWIGAKLLPEPQTKADLGQLLRTIGFASAPGAVRLFGIIPGLAALLFPAAGLWMLAAMVVAVRQALDYSGTARAVAVCLLSWLVQVLLLIALLYLVGGPPQAG